MTLPASAIDLILPSKLANRMRDHLRDGEVIRPDEASCCLVHIPLLLPLRGGRRSIETGRTAASAPDPVLIGALRKAHAMTERDATGRPIIQAAPISPYDRRILRLAFLAPDIQRGILAGTQPAGLNLEMLVHKDIPIEWSAQRRALGWSA